MDAVGVEEGLAVTVAEKDGHGNVCITCLDNGAWCPTWGPTSPKRK
jgi:hypothetical protein